MNTTKKQSPLAVLVVMLLAMVSGALCMNKVSPILTQISETLNVTSESQAGFLITIFVLSGIFLAVPVGALVTKLGIFKTGLIALAVTLVGSVIGAVTTNYWVMLLSRLIEGIGLILVGTIGPVAVANAYDNKHRGTAIGLLMCYMSFGRIIALNVAPVIAAAGSWQNVWWISAAYAAVILVMWLIVMRKSDVPAPAADAAGDANKHVIKSILKNKSVMLLCLTFLLFCLSHFGVFNILPTYLTTVHSMSASTAGTITSIASIVGIPVGIIGGMIADKVGSRKKPLVVIMLLSAVTFAVIPYFPTSAMVGMSILYGIATMAQAGLCFSAVTELVADPSQGGMGAAFVNMSMWAGIFCSSPLFGTILDSAGWNTTFLAMAAIAVLGAIVTLLNKDMK